MVHLIQRNLYNLVTLFDCWYFQLSSTVTPSAGHGGKGSPCSTSLGKYFFMRLHQQSLLCMSCA